MTLHRLLQHLNRAEATVIFVVVSVRTICLSMVPEPGGRGRCTEASYGSAFGAEASSALVLLCSTAAQRLPGGPVPFGLWLFLLGLFAYRSDMFLRLLGILLMAGPASCLLDVALRFLPRDVADVAFLTILVPLVVVAEVAMRIYLLVRGVRGTDRTA